MYNKFIGGVTSSNKTKARPTTFASAVKIDEASGIHFILQQLSDIPAQPTFVSFLTHVYKSVDTPYNDIVVF